MRYLYTIIGASFLALTLSGQAMYEPVAPAQQQSLPPQTPPTPPPAAAQDVEEPDAPDDDTMGAPEEATPVPKAVTLPKPDAPSAEAGDMNYDEVVLQGLNKVTARAQTLEVPIGSVTRFGTIEIVAHSCWKSAPEERPENAALLEISEIKQGEAPKRIFLGWMFSSSPGLSSLEHPFYDVTVVKCGKSAAEAAPAPAAAPQKPATHSHH